MKYLRTFGETGIIKNGKDGKVGNRGITMVFVGYADEQTCWELLQNVQSGDITSKCDTRRHLAWTHVLHD